MAKSAKEKAALKAAKAAVKKTAKEKIIKKVMAEIIVETPVHHTPLPEKTPAASAAPIDGLAEKGSKLSHEDEALAAMKKHGIKHG